MNAHPNLYMNNQINSIIPVNALYIDQALPVNSHLVIKCVFTAANQIETFR